MGAHRLLAGMRESSGLEYGAGNAGRGTRVQVGDGPADGEHREYARVWPPTAQGLEYGSRKTGWSPGSWLWFLWLFVFGRGEKVRGVWGVGPVG